MATTPTTPFVRLLTEFLLRQQAEDHTYSQAQLARHVGVHRATVGRWLAGSVVPDPNQQIRILHQLGILDGRLPAEMRSARVLGRVDAITGAVEMLEQLHEETIPLPHLEYLLSSHPLWDLTAGDPFLMRLDGSLHGYEFMNKIIVRKPAPNRLLDVLPHTLSVARINGTWRCVCIHHISDSAPYLRFSELQISPVHCIVARDAFEIGFLVIPFTLQAPPSEIF